MYLPKSQYKKLEKSDLSDEVASLRNKAGEIINSNKEVILTATGQLFEKAGIDFDKGDFSKAKELFINLFDEKIDQGTTESPVLSSDSLVKSIKLKPTSKEKKAGFKKRFLYKNKSTGKIKEVLLPIAKVIANNQQKYETLVSFNWLIAGPVEDQNLNGYFLEGIRSRNQKTLDEIKKFIPEADVILKDPLEFVIDTLPVTEKTVIRQEASFDIPAPGRSIPAAKSMHKKYPSKTNSGKVKENLLAKPGQFVLEGTNRPYVGLYHVHPTKGPMVGATHVKSRHSRLVAQNNYRSNQGTIGVQGTTGGYSTPGSTSTSGGGSYSGGSSSGGSSSGGGYGGY